VRDRLGEDRPVVLVEFAGFLFLADELDECPVELREFLCGLVLAVDLVHRAVPDCPGFRDELPPLQVLDVIVEATCANASLLADGCRVEVAIGFADEHFEDADLGFVAEDIHEHRPVGERLVRCLGLAHAYVYTIEWFNAFAILYCDVQISVKA
jgi:hypothetical protein